MFPKAVRKKSNNLEKFLLKTGKTNFCRRFESISWRQHSTYTSPNVLHSAKGPVHCVLTTVHCAQILSSLYTMLSQLCTMSTVNSHIHLCTYKLVWKTNRWLSILLDLEWKSLVLSCRCRGRGLWMQIVEELMEFTWTSMANISYWRVWEFGWKFSIVRIFLVFPAVGITCPLPRDPLTADLSMKTQRADHELSCRGQGGSDSVCFIIPDRP